MRRRKQWVPVGLGSLFISVFLGLFNAVQTTSQEKTTLNPRAAIERALKGDEKKTSKSYRQTKSSFQSNKDNSTEQSAQQSADLQTQQSQPRAELVVQMWHKGNVWSVAFSPNGKTLASAGGSTIKLWDVESGKELRTLKGHKGDDSSVAFSPDGRTLASGGNRTIKLWDVRTGKQMRTLIGHEGSVWSVAFSPDGRTLVSAGVGTIKLWDVESGKELPTLKGHEGPAISVAFSPDGKTLASGSRDYGTIKLWDVKSGEKLRTLIGHKGSVYSVAFSPDGRTLVSGGEAGTIKLWDVRTGKQLRSLIGHLGAVGPVAFGPDGKTFASTGLDLPRAESGAYDRTIKLWDAETGKELQTFTGNHGSPAFSPDGNTLASGSWDRIVKLWDVRTGKQFRTLKGRYGPVWSVAFSPDGKALATGGWDDRTIRLWDMSTGKQIRTLTKQGSAWSVAFSLDSKTYASAGYDASGYVTIKLSDVESGKELRTLTGDYLAVAFSPDGKVFASGGNGGTIKLWDVRTGKQLRALSGPKGTVLSVAFSPDGRTLASGSRVTMRSPDTIKLWDVKSGQELRILTGQDRAVEEIAFSPDGKILALIGRDSPTIELWDVRTGRQRRTRIGHEYEYPVKSFAFSPDGKTLASGSWDDGAIKLWDVKSGKELRILTGHEGAVESISFSPDGRTLASGSEDGKTKLWDVATSRELCSLIELGDNDWVVVTPDGRFDINKIEDTQGLHWVVSDNPLTPVPLEIFMRDYYEPNLLARLMRCTRENNCNKEFKPVRDFTSLNRTQPNVKITDIEAVPNTDTVTVTVEVANVTSKFQHDRQNKPLQSGVFDVRVFRDGQLVSYAPGNDGAVELNAKGKATLKFSNIKLPRTGVEKVEFSVYAFNADRVKSATNSKAYTLTPQRTRVKGRAYIIALGVNAYESEGLNLRYAANDARQVQKNLEPRLAAQGEYQEVVSVQLVSDYAVTLADGRRQAAQDVTLEKGEKLKDFLGRSRPVVTENGATKAHLQAVLDVLAGRPANAALLKDIPDSDKLRPARPEDLIIISASSHGYTDSSGIFYLVPSDTGTAPISSPEFRSHCVSSDELSRWLRDVDAGELVLIVDACHSTAAVEGTDFKPGPMGSSGLGQLSYDKGMRILTATQSDNVALESNKVRQGLLTYALLQDGLGAWRADYKPKDNSIILTEWLSYGVERVPRLYEEVKAGQLKSHSEARIIRDIVDLGELDNEKYQQPSLFDFARQRREIVLARHP